MFNFDVGPLDLCASVNNGFDLMDRLNLIIQALQYTNLFFKPPNRLTTNAHRIAL